jgi:hypothetical protein
MVVLNSNTDAVLIGLGVGGVMQYPGFRAWHCRLPAHGCRNQPRSRSIEEVAAIVIADASWLIV